MKSFQKSANKVHALHLSHPGIISSKDFNEHFELRCYEPFRDLKPFVSHIWTQRQKATPNEPPKPTEILSGPNIYLFFTPDGAFIHTITSRTFTYNPLASGAIAGIKFRPGGFYPFFERPISTLQPNTPATFLFPQADKAFTTRLLSQPDAAIISALEALLRSKQPTPSKNLALITKILNTLELNPSLQTVAQVAQHFTISERSLQLLFQTHVGIGLKWVISRRRLMKAVERGKAKDHPTWLEIAAETGYSSQSHLSREFKRVTGQAPSQFVKRSRRTQRESNSLLQG